MKIWKEGRRKINKYESVQQQHAGTRRRGGEEKGYSKRIINRREYILKHFKQDS